VSSWDWALVSQLFIEVLLHYTLKAKIAFLKSFPYRESNLRLASQHANHCTIGLLENFNSIALNFELVCVLAKLQ